MLVLRAVRTVALAALLAACSPRPQTAAPERPAPPAAAEPSAAVAPPAPPALGRAEILAAAGAAAAAYAAGEPYPSAAAALAGRRFVLRLPFGCYGPAPDAGAGYVFDAEKGTLKLTVRPQVWTDAPWVRELVGAPEAEAIDGFWIRRPWMTAEACPAVGGAPGAATAPETVGLVRVFEPGASRLARRGGRPYEVTEKAEDGAPPGQGGFRLVLEGRVMEPASGQPVRCRGDGPDVRPVCLLLVDFDRVAMEDARGRQLAEWRS